MRNDKLLRIWEKEMVEENYFLVLARKALFWLWCCCSLAASSRGRVGGEGSHIGRLRSRTLWRRCGSFRFPWQLATGFVNVVAVAFLDDSTRKVKESLDVILKV